jgi:hypothetical protein
LSHDLRIEIPPESRNEREYALSVLLNEWLGLTYVVQVVEGLKETQLRLASGAGDAVIAIPDVLLARSTHWLSPDSLPASPLPLAPPAPWTGLEVPFPLMYRSGKGDELVRRDGDRFVLCWDLIGSALFMLSRYEEYVRRGNPDAHGRFPATASVLATSGWLQWPVLDMYLAVFVALMKLAWPRLQIAPVEYDRFVVGHDVDHPSSPMRWPGRQRLRVLAGDVGRRRDLGLALRRASSFAAGASNVSRLDPFNTYNFLMRASEVNDVSSTFFFLTRDSHLPDGSRYRVDDPWAVRLTSEIARRGHSIGLHGSYNSSTDSRRLRDEWAALEAACREIAPGVLRRSIRQHYLRWEPGVTWSAQADAGLSLDESLGYADAIGYRAGTARQFRAYDLNRHAPLSLRVRPLHVMDVTLLHYMSLERAETFRMVAEMAQRTRMFGGALSILWHNSSLETAAAKRLYLTLLTLLAA